MKKILALISCMVILFLVHSAGAGGSPESEDKQIEDLSKKAFRYSTGDGDSALTLITGYTGKISDQEWYKAGFGESCDDNVAVLSSPEMALAIPETSKILAFLDCPAAGPTQPESIVAVFDRGNMNVPLCFSRLNLLEETSDVSYYFWGAPNSIEARRAPNGALYVVASLSGADGGDCWESFAFLHIDMSCRITILSKLGTGYHCNGGCRGSRMEYRFIGNGIVKVTETSFTAGENGPEKTVKTVWKNYHLATLLNNSKIRVFPSKTERAAAMLHSGDVNIKDEAGTTPLMWAARDGFPELVKGLLEKGAEVNAKDNNGRTPLIWATLRCCPEPVKWVTDKGEDVSDMELYADTPPVEPGKNGCMPILRLLLDRGADVNTRDKYGQTPLMHLAERGSPEIIQALLEKGADVNVEDKAGWTALMSAAKADHLEAVRLLLDRGADINAKTKDGRTALKVARAKGNKPIEELLRERGAKE